MLSPRVRFSCRTVTFMAGPLCSENFQKYITSIPPNLNISIKGYDFM
jgi:hypothetical protein